MISITEFFRKKQICRGTTGVPGKPADGGNKKRRCGTTLALLVGGVTAGQRADSCGGAEQNKTNRGVIV